MDVDLLLKKDTLSFDWKFDRINSTLLFFEADKNKNGSLDTNEEKRMIKRLFEPLKKDEYFIAIEQNDDSPITPKNVRFLYIKKRVHITFDVDTKNPIVICNIDPVSYFAFRLKNVSTIFKTSVQKDMYDFCLGVQK